MENASDAIIMAGAVLIFVIALTVAMTVFSQARATVDTVVYASDRTNYYEYLEMDISNNIKNRIVGLETIIPTLYKYYKENYTVVFLDENGKGLELYKTQTNKDNWTKYEKEDGVYGIKDFTVDKYPGMENESKKENPRICSFDVNEELVRREPWVGDPIETRKNLEAFIEGKEYVWPNGSGKAYDYKNIMNGKSFMEYFSGEKFRETIGEYRTNNKDTFASELNQGIRDNKNKRVIVYQLIKDN
ncbi:MAG: hypothetical protein HFJ30_01520 [Clostridia bacterium]|nr:hypothetical protein [Clostridia bacterium]